MIVAVDESAKAPLVAQNRLQKIPVCGRGHSVQRIKSGHDRPHTGVDGSLERRKVNLAQHPLRHIDRVVIAPRLGCTVCGEMLRAGEDRVRRRDVLSLKAAHVRDGHRRAEIRIFAGAFGNAAPPWIAGDVDHRSERPSNAAGAGLARGDSRRQLGRTRIPRAGDPQRDREDRPETVDDIVREEQRDLQSRLFDGDALQSIRLRGSAEVECAADAAARHQFTDVGL